jgi:hypothetical protein
MLLWRDNDGTIRRKTDIFEERWEVVTDAEELGRFTEWFNNRDIAAANNLL